MSEMVHMDALDKHQAALEGTSRYAAIHDSAVQDVGHSYVHYRLICKPDAQCYKSQPGLHLSELR